MGEQGESRGTPRSRREVIVKAGVVGAVAWTAPVVASLASPAAAASGGIIPPPPGCVRFPSFTGLSAFNVQATQFGSPTNTFPAIGPANELRLTDVNTLGLGVSAWYSTPQPVSGGFTTDFQFRLSNPVDLPADGIAFVIQNQASNALGGEGGDMGYTGITNSLAIELDIWDNGIDQGPPVAVWDPNGNHVAVHSNGTGANNANESLVSLSATDDLTSVPGPTLADGNVHTLQITYAGTTLTVSLDGTPRPLLTVSSLDVNTLLGLAGGPAYVGFTGATGGATADQDILNWNFCPTPP